MSLRPRSVLTRAVLHRAPSTTLSGSTGTWRRTACVVSTEQRAKTATWCCAAGKVGHALTSGLCRNPGLADGLEQWDGSCGQGWLLSAETWGYQSLLWVCGWSMTGPCFPGCACTFKDHCKLREHLRSHTQEKVVACPTCGGMFANNTKFLDHIRRQTSLDRKQLEGSGCRLFCSWTLGAHSQGGAPEGVCNLAPFPFRAQSPASLC